MSAICLAECVSACLDIDQQFPQLLYRCFYTKRMGATPSLNPSPSGGGTLRKAAARGKAACCGIILLPLPFGKGAGGMGSSTELGSYAIR